MTTEIEQKNAPPNILLLAFTIIAYSTISIAIVYYNHGFFTTGFRYPVFISWWQQIFGTVGFLILANLARVIPSLKKPFPVTSLNLKTCIKLIPLALTFVLFIAASNTCLQYTLITTYLVARSCTLLFVLILSYLMLKKKESLLTIVSCLIMVAGFVVNSLDPSTLSFIGLVCGCISSFFQALYNVIIKKFLGYVNNDSQVLLLYNMALSSVLFIPVVLLCEGVTPFKLAVSQDQNLYAIWTGIAISGLLSTSMNMFQYLLIRLTNPLASNIIGLMKSLLQTIGGFVIYRDPMTPNSIAGITLSLLGSGIYCFCKNRDYFADRKKRQLEEPTIPAYEKPRSIEQKV